MAHITRNDPKTTEIDRIRREARAKGRQLDPKAKAEEAWAKLTRGDRLGVVRRPQGY